MNFNQISPGENPPDDFNVVIEIPTDGQPVKYEVDKATGAFEVSGDVNLNVSALSFRVPEPTSLALLGLAGLLGLRRR